MNDLRYPIGPFQMEDEINDVRRQHLIEQVAELPDNLREAVTGLKFEQLDTQYRPDGWTLRQVVHHLVDSHINAFIRFKLALTEEKPVIKPYDQEKWANLTDAIESPVEASLDMLSGMYQRWIILLQSLNTMDFSRSFHHPESGELALDQYLAMCAWHGRHHVAHITALRNRMNW